MVTFSKRRQGLFKKAQEYAAKTGSLVAVLVFSPAGKPFVNGSPCFDTVVEEFVRENCCQGGVVRTGDNTLIGDEGGQGGGGGGEVAEVFSGLEEKMRRRESVEELMEVKSVLEEMRSKVVKRLNHVEDGDFLSSLYS